MATVSDRCHGDYKAGNIVRKYFGIVQILVRAFTRRAVWMILLPISVTGMLFFYWLASESEPHLALHMTTYFQAMMTLIFSMMGIELHREQQRENIADMLAVYSKRTVFFLWGQVLAIGLMDLIVTFMMMAGCLIRLLIDHAPFLWIDQTMAYILLLYFLPCWILGVLGLFIARRFKGKSVYVIVISLWLFTSSLNAGLLQYAEAMGAESSGFLLNLLNMGIIKYYNVTNIVTKIPTELPKWIVRIGILLLLTGLFLGDGIRQFTSTRLQRRRSWLASVSVIVCGIAFVSFCYLRFSVFFTQFADPDEVSRYARIKSSEYIPGELVSLADYPAEKNITLIHTDIDLHCTTQGIEVEVVMETTADQLISEQSFTLYSDLIVDKVLVDGTEAEFLRNHDGLMVYIQGGREANDAVTFTFRYHGYSLPVFPANETNVQLNRAFPWIPWPGIKKTTRYENYYSYNESEDFFVEDWQREDEVTYALQYRGPGNLYTNLDALGEQLYTGTTNNGVSIYSGMVHYNLRGVDVFVPASLHQSARWAVEALLDAYDPLLEQCTRMGTKRMPEKPKSIILVQMKCPLINTLVEPSELYSWGDEWEIRQSNDTSSTVNMKKRYADSADEYQAVMMKMAVSYLLNPCTGYPIDVSHASTRNYAAWLSMYLTVGLMDEDEQAFFRDMLIEEYTGKGRENINGILVPEIPLTSEEESWIDDILDRMDAGENFDEPFAALYQGLLQQKSITASDIVTQLYLHQGE